MFDVVLEIARELNDCLEKIGVKTNFGVMSIDKESNSWTIESEEPFDIRVEYRNGVVKITNVGPFGMVTTYLDLILQELSRDSNEAIEKFVILVNKVREVVSKYFKVEKVVVNVVDKVLLPIDLEKVDLAKALRIWKLARDLVTTYLS